MDGHTTVWLVLIIIVAIVLFVLVAYTSRNKGRVSGESFSEPEDAFAEEDEDDADGSSSVFSKKNIKQKQQQQKKKKLGARQSKLGKLKDDVDGDLKSEVSNTGKYLINKGYSAGEHVPVDFQKATRPHTLDAAADEDEGNDEENEDEDDNGGEPAVRPVRGGGAGGVAPVESSGNEMHLPVDLPSSTPSLPGGGGGDGDNGPNAYPGERFDIKDLMPTDAANLPWAMANPAGQGDVADQNFVNAGYHMGMITNTKKNPNMQLRSEPPNPRHATGIWNQSTIDPDITRRPFEVGGI